jgi:hypothetical protein
MLESECPPQIGGRNQWIFPAIDNNIPFLHCGFIFDRPEAGPVLESGARPREGLVGACSGTVAVVVVDLVRGNGSTTRRGVIVASAEADETCDCISISSRSIISFGRISIV